MTSLRLMRPLACARILSYRSIFAHEKELRVAAPILLHHFTTFRNPRYPPFIPAGSRRFATSELPPHIVLGMPALSPTMTQGNVISWKKKEGEQIMPGDVLCIVETDKATVDFESVEEGYLAKILVPSGSNNVPIGQTIGIMVESSDDIQKIASSDLGAKVPNKVESTSPSASQKQQSQSTSQSFSAVSRSSAVKNMGPSVRKLLAENRIDASSITGTGPRGLVLKGDVLAAIKGGKASPSSSSSPSTSTSTSTSASTSTSSFHDLPNTQIRKIIAKRLMESKHDVPHFYINSDAVLDDTLLLRKEMKEKHGVSVSVNDFIIKAAALALKSLPEANAYWDEKSGEVVMHKTVDISIAVATDKGLITPIVRNADMKSLSAISAEVKGLAEKARNGKLKPEEFQGGTFSISNLGMFPVDRFCAIINPPQACILAVGKGEKSVIWDKCQGNEGEGEGEGEGEDEGEVEGEGKARVATKMGMTLSVDNRVYDAQLGAKLLAALAANMEDPKRMLL